MERIRIINAEKFLQLDQNIQKKLREAKSRKESIDLENFEKLELSVNRLNFFISGHKKLPACLDLNC